MDSFDRLKIRPGQDITPARWNRLMALLRSATPRSGRNTTMRRLTSGTIFSFRGKRGGIGLTGMFLMSLDSGPGDTVRLTVGRGLIGGLMPQIQSEGGLVPIFDPAAPDAEPPYLTINASSFSNGICHIFAKVKVAGDLFFADKVEIVAKKERPKGEAFTAYKLIGWLSAPDGRPQNATVLQMCHHNQAFVATNINTLTGSFRAFFIAE
jgi:hypothetical protein